MNARALATDAEGDRVTTDRLIADLRVLAADTEQLLKATANQTGQQVAQVRARAAESLKAARARVADLQDVERTKTRAAGRATDDYVRANPWQVIAICAVAGLVLGFVLAPGRDSDA
jgi:ElaB/YqjD/DUF883 family membrane-anchored ribosome-binding protein